MSLGALDARAMAGSRRAACARPGHHAAAFNLHTRIRKRRETASGVPAEDAALLGEALHAMQSIARDLAGIPRLQAATDGDFARNIFHLTGEPAPGGPWGFDVQQTCVLHEWLEDRQ